MLSLAIAGGALACYRLCGDYAPGAPGSMVLLAAGLPLLFGIAVAPARRAAIVRVLAIAAVLPVVDLVGRAVEVRVHALPLVNHALSWLAGLVGMPASVAGGLLNVRAHEGLIAFAASFDKLALRPVASVVIACLLATRSWSRTGVLALAAAMLAVLRYGVLLLWFADRDGALVPKDGWALGVFTSDLTVLPLLLAVALLGTRGIARPAPASRLELALALVGGILLGCVTQFVPSGEEKPGRVLIDDHLSSCWEPTARRLDTEYYGDFSTYSMTSLAEWLGRRFSVQVNTTRALDDRLLGDVDVLILKTPEQPYRDDEVAAVHRFVDRGGGLLLISDHTNLLGMSSHLNRIAERYGMTFRYDAVSRSDGGFSEFAAGSLAHPIAAGLERFVFMTSCSLDIDWHARPAMIAADSTREPHDYSTASFFSHRAGDPAFESGPLVLCATADAGCGRVALFTDSTVFSSFDVFKYDRDRLALNLITFLNHAAPPATWPRTVLAVIGIVLSVLALWRRRAAAWLVAALAFLAGGALGSGMSRLAPPPESSPSVTVSFLWQGGFCAFPPALGGTGDVPDDALFDTLFVATERLGLRPRIAYRYEDACEDAQALVVINPVRTPPARFLDQLQRWVEDGGQLIVIDPSDASDRAASNALLARFGMALEHAEGGTRVCGATRWPLASDRLAAFVSDAGRGGVTWLRGSELLTRQGLGHCFQVPDSSARPLYASVYALLSDRAALKPATRRTYGILE